MIDVVFLLIIFFLGQQPSGAAGIANGVGPCRRPLRPGTTWISQTPRLTINVQIRWIVVACRDVPSPRNSSSNNSSRPGPRKAKTLRFEFAAVAAAPYSTVEPIMLACTGAKIWNVTYAVYREESQ